MGYNLAADDLLKNLRQYLVQGRCHEPNLPPRGGTGGGGGGDLALDELELGITALRKRFIKSSVRKTGPSNSEAEGSEPRKYDITGGRVTGFSSSLSFSFSCLRGGGNGGRSRSLLEGGGGLYRRPLEDEGPSRELSHRSLSDDRGGGEFGRARLCDGP